MKFTAINAKIWSRLGSCGALGLSLIEAAQNDERVVAVTADLQFYSGLDRFAGKFPERMYNVGIAEQDMVDVAAGMAKEGLIPFATTYGTFASTRASDQVRVSMGYMGLPVMLVGLTAGLSVGILGPTHISLEDLAIMRSIPNITILSPADCTETCKAVLAAAEMDGPVYLRLTGTLNNPIVYSGDYDFEVGRSIVLREGSDIAIIATGTMVYNSLKAADTLQEQGYSDKVIDMHTIRPLDVDALQACLDAKLIVTVEEHGVVGGLGSAVAETLAPIRVKPPQLIIGCECRYEHAGDYPYLIERYGLTSEAIAQKILDVLDKLQ